MKWLTKMNINGLQQCNSNVFIKVANETMRKLLVTQRGPASKRMIDIALENFKERVPDEMISYTGNRQKNWKLRPESDLTIQNTSRYGPRLFVAGKITNKAFENRK